jgi:hypothetical protein
MLANRILVAKEPLGEELVDDNHGLVALDASPVDAVTTSEPDAHGLEVAAGDRVEQCNGRDGAGRVRPASHPYRVAGTRAGEGQARGRRRGGHAGQRRHSFENRAMGGNGGASIPIVAIGQSDAECERGCGVEPGIERAQLLKAANHQTRRYEEDQRQRDLASHQ